MFEKDPSKRPTAFQIMGKIEVKFELLIFELNKHFNLFYLEIKQSHIGLRRHIFDK